MTTPEIKMLLTTMYDRYKYSDLYDFTNGILIHRSRYDRLSIPSSMVLEGNDGKIIKIITKLE